MTYSRYCISCDRHIDEGSGIVVSRPTHDCHGTLMCHQCYLRKQWEPRESADPVYSDSDLVAERRESPGRSVRPSGLSGTANQAKSIDHAASLWNA